MAAPRSSRALGSGPVVTENIQSTTGDDKKIVRRWIWIVTGIVLVVTLTRIYWAQHAELVPDEAYYWLYSKHPALSYYDHPPMVGRVIAFGTRIFGDTELGVRAGSLLLGLVCCPLLYLVGRLWFGAAAGLGAVLLFAVLPVYMGTGSLASTDEPLLFFWLVTLYAVSKALLEKQTSARRSTMFWLLGGVSFGLALLTKYPAALLAPSLFLFLLLSPTHRSWLRRPQPWLAAAIALLVFSPVLVWNAQHDWVSFSFQSTRAGGPSSLSLQYVPGFWTKHLLLLTPLIFAWYVVAVARGIRRGWFRGEDNWNFAVSFCLPLFTVFALASFGTRAHNNWTAPAFLSLTPAAVAAFQEMVARSDAKRRAWWRRAAGLATFLAFAGIPVTISATLWGVPKKLAYRHGGWREMARHVEATARALQERTGQRPFVLGGDTYKIAAELDFYTRQPEDHVSAFALGMDGRGFRYWTKLEDFQGRPAVVVTLADDPEIEAALPRHFDQVGETVPVEIVTPTGRRRMMYLTECLGYRAPAP